MTAEAQAQGADGIVCMRFMTASVMQGVLSMACHSICPVSATPAYQLIVNER